MALRMRYEAEFGRVSDKRYPCDALVEKRFEEVDEGEVRADPLTEAVSRDELQEDPVGAVVDRDGAIRLRKAPKSVPMPRNSEELRVKVRLLGITFTLARYKHAQRPWLGGASVVE